VRITYLDQRAYERRRVERQLGLSLEYSDLITHREDFAAAIGDVMLALSHADGSRWQVLGVYRVEEWEETGDAVFIRLAPNKLLVPDWVDDDELALKPDFWPKRMADDAVARLGVDLVEADK
jgi:hypothetical protein